MVLRRTLHRTLRLFLVLTVAACLGLPSAAASASDQGGRLTQEGLRDLLAASPGRVVAVNYWASWCGPCLTEMPTLKAMRTAYAPDDLTLLAVSFDFDPKAHERMLARLDLNFPSHLAQENLMQSLGVTTVPRTDFYDSQRRLVRSHEGLLTAEEFRAIVSSITASGVPAKIP